MRPLLIAAVLALAAPVTAALSVPAAAAAQARWHAPVPGPPARPFAFDGRAFAAGEHRGVDLVARPGETVEATCSGRVAVARRVGSTGRVVTLRCGPWRVTHLPLATITVRPGALVGRGEPIGTAGRAEGHEGLHLGVRREGESSGYVDPLRFLGRIPHPPPPAGPVRTASRGRRGPGSNPVPAPAREPAPAPPRQPAPAPARIPAPAPWPVWAGLAVLLAGAGGTTLGLRAPARRRRAALPTPLAERLR